MIDKDFKLRKREKKKGKKERGKERGKVLP
jgi:hypothetical protein